MKLFRKWSKRKSEAAKRLAPILDKETSKNRDVEWLRYTMRIKQITTLICGFELTDEQAEELKRKMSEATSRQLSCDSVCKIKAMDVRTDKWCYLTLIKNSDGKLILDWTQCGGCGVGKMIDFDTNNSFWKDDYYGSWEGVFYAIAQ